MNMSRVYDKYKEKISKELKEEFKYSSDMQVPRLEKIVLNMGVGDAMENAKVIDHAVYTLTQITGQKPMVTRAKKAIASFKLKQNAPVGCTVTLRRSRMYEFFDRLVSVALPRVKDFKGLPTKGFDGRGSFTLGMKEQIVFPEIDIDKIDKIRGMNITFVTSANSDKESLALLSKLGMPFKQAKDATKSEQKLNNN